jgi:hypothetical protein
VTHDRYLHLKLLEMCDIADDDALIMEHIPYIKHEKIVSQSVIPDPQPLKIERENLTGACGEDLFVVGQADSQFVQGVDRPDEVGPFSFLFFG